MRIAPALVHFRLYTVLLRKSRIGALDKIRCVFRRVLGGLRHVVAKAPENLIAHHIRMYIFPCKSAFANLRINVHTVLFQLQKPCLMVDPRDLITQMVCWHSKSAQKIRRTDLHAVAQADHFNACAFQHRARNDRHRIDVIEQPRIRADLHHIPHDVLHDRNCTQSAENTADPKRIGICLLQPVLCRNLKIRHHTPISADLDRADHKVCTAQRLLLAGISSDVRPTGIDTFIQALKHPL